MRFFQYVTLILGLALAGTATPASADISNKGIFNWRVNTTDTLIRQEEYRTFRSSEDGLRYQTAWLVWERRNGSRYKRYTWCQLDHPKRCAARSSIIELRGATTVPEPTPHTGNGTVARKPINSNDQYISQRAYSVHGNSESAWVKFARRNGNMYEVYTTCRINTSSCLNGEVRELGYDRRYDRNHLHNNRGIDWNNLTKEQQDCLAVFGIFGSIADDEKIKDLAAICLLIK